MRDSTVSGNVATGAGGGIASLGGGLLGRRRQAPACREHRQGAAGGGAIYAVGGGTVTLRDDTLTGNSASSLAGRGGAISLANRTGPTRIERTEIKSNTASGKGGALANRGGARPAARSS